MKEFKDFLFAKFKEWESEQPKLRPSFSEYARWLSDNSMNIAIPQQMVDGWLNGRFKPGVKYAPLLAEKLGNEIYQYLNLDPLLTYITTHWDQLPPEIQNSVHEQIAHYLATQMQKTLTLETEPEILRTILRSLIKTITIHQIGNTIEGQITIYTPPHLYPNKSPPAIIPTASITQPPLGAPLYTRSFTLTRKRPG